MASAQYTWRLLLVLNTRAMNTKKIVPRYFVTFVNRYVSREARLRVLEKKPVKIVNEFIPGKTIGYESFSE